MLSPALGPLARCAWRTGATTIAVIAAIVGCTINPAVQLYNGTHSPILVVSGKEGLVIDSQQSAVLKSVVGEGGDLSICLNAELSTYSVDFVPAQYAKVGAVSATIRVQIGDDRLLRVLKPEDEFPLPPNTPQPDHYPTAPELGGPCQARSSPKILAPLPGAKLAAIARAT